MKADLIVHNAQIVSCASRGKPLKGKEMADAGVIKDGAVAVDAGRIVAIGASAQILREFDAAETIDAGESVVSPGFVECHTHIVFGGDRLNEFELKIKGADYLEILRSGGGILSTVRQTRAASRESLVGQAWRRLDKMVALGVTTCEIKTGYGLNEETEFKMLDVIAELDASHPLDIVPTFLAAHAVPKDDYRAGDPTLSDEAIGDLYTDTVCRSMIPRLVGWRDAKGFDGRPMFVDVFCENGAFTLAQSRRVLETARASGLGIKAHVDEFKNLGGSRMCIELGATSIDHLDAISDEEIVLLAGSPTIGVVTPTVNFNLGSCDFAPARKLIDAGCAIALSTDYNPGSAPCPSLPNAMAIACRYQKMLPSEAFVAATINAAFAIGLGTETGSLEPGKWADLIIFDTKDHREVAYEFGGNPVKTVYKRGNRVPI